MRLFAITLALATAMHAALAMLNPWEVRDGEDQLGQDIARIATQDDGAEATRRDLEARLIGLIGDQTAAEDKGLIYASIADMYAQPRGHPPTAEDMDAAAKFAKMALREPLDPRNACRMYSVWAGAAFGRGHERSSVEFAAARRRAVLLYLQGLKCALDNGAPADRVHVPAVWAYLVLGSPDSPDVQAAEARHAQQMEAHERAMRLNELAHYRYFFVIDCIFLYDKPPYDPDELKAFAEEILVGHEEVAAGIMKKLKWWQENKTGWHGPFPRDSELPPEVRDAAQETDQPNAAAPPTGAVPELGVGPEG